MKFFVIEQTPGLVEEGSFPLCAEAIKKGDINTPDWDESVAAFHTREAAKAAMMKLVPEGHDPATYAGLGVAEKHEWEITHPDIEFMNTDQ